MESPPPPPICELDLDASLLDVCFLGRSVFFMPSKKPRFGLGLLRSPAADFDDDDDVSALSFCIAATDDDGDALPLFFAVVELPPAVACCIEVGMDLVRVCLPPAALSFCLDESVAPPAPPPLPPPFLAFVVLCAGCDCVLFSCLRCLVSLKLG